jgi:hypothetical protein
MKGTLARFLYVFVTATTILAYAVAAGLVLERRAPTSL